MILLILLKLFWAKVDNYKKETKMLKKPRFNFDTYLEKDKTVIGTLSQPITSIPRIPND